MRLTLKGAKIDGKLYPPMATKGAEPIKLGVWEQSDENGEPALYFTLRKDNGTTVPARYNPYIHTSQSPLNDQFKSAWNRPNMVVVEVVTK